MVDAVSAQQPLKPFTTVMYTTKDGEHVTATKKDGVVTLNGDKNGIRQMPVDDFLTKELPENVANVNLEKSPEKDTLELSAKPAEEASAAKDAPAVEEAPKAEPVKAEVKAETDVKVSEEPKAEAKKLDVAA